MPVAIDTTFLRKHPVYSFTIADERLVAVTSRDGANRVYLGGATFPDQRATAAIVDANGDAWRVTESALVLVRDTTTRLPRVAAQRAFWFGWYAQFPETVLIQLSDECAYLPGLNSPRRSRRRRRRSNQL